MMMPVELGTIVLLQKDTVGRDERMQVLGQSSGLFGIVPG